MSIAKSCVNTNEYWLDKEVWESLIGFPFLKNYIQMTNEALTLGFHFIRGKFSIKLSPPPPPPPPPPHHLSFPPPPPNTFSGSANCISFYYNLWNVDKYTFLRWSAKSRESGSRVQSAAGQLPAERSAAPHQTDRHRTLAECSVWCCGQALRTKPSTTISFAPHKCYTTYTVPHMYRW